MDLNEALEMFTDAFFKQTGNVFGKPFVKQPGKYMLMDIQYVDVSSKY